MSTLYAPAPAPMTLAPPPLARLARIELRKSTDTRAGRWLLVLITLIALGTAVASAVTGHQSSHTLVHILGETGQLTSILLPVLGVLLVSSEWSQRSALTTFSLVPRRSRIVAAKSAAGVLLAAAAAAACTVIAVAAALAGHGPAGTWHGAAAAIGYAFVFQILNVLLGVGFGLLFRSTPVAIVVYFAVPTAWSILTGTVTALSGTGHWLDPSTAWNHLAGGTVTGTTWAQVASTAAVWVVLPLAAGLWRVTRRPVE
jgi:ABC-2 type transport system permease protein